MRVAEELRVLFDAVAERAQPWLNQLLESGGPGDAHGASSCGWCPLCATISLVRGDRPELAERLATHTLGLLGTLRAAMEPESDSGPRRRPASAAPGAESTGAPTGASAADAPAAENRGSGAAGADEPVSAPGPAVQHIAVERIGRP